MYNKPTVTFSTLESDNYAFNVKLVSRARSLKYNDLIR